MARQAVPDMTRCGREAMTTDQLSSARLRLVPLTVADAAEMVGVLSGDALYAFTGGAPPGLDELRARYAGQVAGRSPDGREEWRNWILRRQPGGQAVGYVQATITGEGRRAEIAWVVGLEWQGQGYATEAARALVSWLDSRGAQIIQAHIHPGHAASAAVASRAGLRPSGVAEDGEQLWLRDRPAAGPRPGDGGTGP
jgi:RimJ/RimL family protein N-acetyltransferase